jgi:hypothetical protein
LSQLVGHFAPTYPFLFLQFPSFFAFSLARFSFFKTAYIKQDGHFGVGSAESAHVVVMSASIDPGEWQAAGVTWMN